MQTEALAWFIAEEKKIGFRDAGDEEKYLRPLERQLKRIQEKVEMAAGQSVIAPLANRI